MDHWEKQTFLEESFTSPCHERSWRWFSPVTQFTEQFYHMEVVSARSSSQLKSTLTSLKEPIFKGIIILLNSAVKKRMLRDDVMLVWGFLTVTQRVDVISPQTAIHFGRGNILSFMIISMSSLLHNCKKAMLLLLVVIMRMVNFSGMTSIFLLPLFRSSPSIRIDSSRDSDNRNSWEEKDHYD